MVIIPENVLDFGIEGRDPAIKIAKRLAHLEGRDAWFFAKIVLLGLGRAM